MKLAEAEKLTEEQGRKLFFHMDDCPSTSEQILMKPGLVSKNIMHYGHRTK